MKRPTFALAAALVAALMPGAAHAMPLAWIVAPNEAPEQPRAIDPASVLLARFFEPAVTRGATRSGFVSDAFDDGDLAVLERLDPVAFELDPRAGDLALEGADDAAGTGCELALDAAGLFAERERDLSRGAPDTPELPNGHFEKDGTWVDYDQIPRREGRPEEYVAYRYPIDEHEAFFVASGYDLDKPDAEQRRGTMSAVGHGGFDLAAKKGTPIESLRLENQIGDSEVLYVGWLFGESVVTRHTIREGGKAREYVVIFGHLQEPADGVRRGLRLRAGQLVGFVGDTGSPEFPHLHLEARRVRDGVDAWAIAPRAILLREVSTVSDPRNVLPLKMAPRRPRARCTPRLFSARKRTWLEGFSLLFGER